MSDLNLTDYPTGCVCFSPKQLEDGGCVCSDDERLVRARIYGKLKAPLYVDERDRLSQDADYCFKGERLYAELIQLDDVDLCRATLDGWMSMARKHGLV